MNEFKKWVEHLKGWQSVSDDLNIEALVKYIEIKYYLPFGLPLSNGNGIVNNGSENIQIELEVKQKPSIKSDEGDKIKIPAVTLSPSMRMWNDRFGQNNFTPMKFVFQIDPEKKLTELPEDVFVEKSVGAVNQILDGCRMVSDKFTPRNFIRLDIAAYNIAYFDSAGKGVFSTGGSGGGGKIMSNELLNKSQLNKLDQILKNNSRLSLEQELILNAKDYLLFENYRMACIEIQSAVETALSNKIKNYFEKTMNSEELSKILRKRWDDIKPHLKQATNETIIQTDECQNWRTKCAEIRHRVIHRQYYPTKNETIDAIESGTSFVELLNQY